MVYFLKKCVHQLSNALRVFDKSGFRKLNKAGQPFNPAEKAGLRKSSAMQP